MAGVLVTLGRANRSGSYEWTSPEVVTIPAGEWVFLTGDIRETHLIDPARAITWEIWRGDGTTWLRLLAGTWQGSADSGQPEIGLPGDAVTGSLARVRAVITGTINFGLTVETRA